MVKFIKECAPLNRYHTHKKKLNRIVHKSLNSVARYLGLNLFGYYHNILDHQSHFIQLKLKFASGGSFVNLMDNLKPIFIG